MKNLLKKTGLENTKVVFLLNDSQIIDDNFLEDINTLLNSGDISSLFDNEEKSALIDKVKFDQPKTLNIQYLINQFTKFQNTYEHRHETKPADLYDKFIERVKTNLHVILAFSPVGSNLRNQLRIFPSLINCCIIDWFHEWPDQALELVAHKFLDDVELNEIFKKQAVQMCKLFHHSTINLSKK